MKIIFPDKWPIQKWPQGSITQFFGENPALYQSALGLKAHNGLDIVDVYGTPVPAFHEGQVVKVYYQGQGYGNEVCILSPLENGKHLLSIYAHLTEEKLVKEDDFVQAGQIIGKMGNSGFVVSGGVVYWGNSNPDKKGTHLHWTTKYLIPSIAQSNTAYLGKNYLIENYHNGYFGAFNPLNLLEKFMNQAKVVKSKKSQAIYVCYEMPDMEYLAKKTKLEGILVPDPVPDTDSL